MDIGSENPQWTFMDAAEQHALDGIAKLVSWSGSNKVSVELRCATVQDSINGIASMKPLTMSWSNVLDYINHRDFHNMARECTRHSETMHFGYSMNWYADIFGTCLIDCFGSHNTESRSKILEDSQNFIRKVYTRRGWEDYFRFPLPQHPVNIVEPVVKDGNFCKVATVSYGVLSPISCWGERTVSFAWTNDETISINYLPE
jgi:hypothetical protein